MAEINGTSIYTRSSVINVFPDELRNERIWLAFNENKIPMDPNNHGVAARWQDVELLTMEEAYKQKDLFFYRYVGIIMRKPIFNEKGQLLCCGDIDFKNPEIQPPEWIPRPDNIDGLRDFVIRASTYAELTVSEKGYHVWFWLDAGGVAPTKNIPDNNGVGIFFHDHAIVMTGNVLNYASATINTIEPSFFGELLKATGYDMNNQKAGTGKKFSMPEQVKPGQINNHLTSFIGSCISQKQPIELILSGVKTQINEGILPYHDKGYVDDVLGIHARLTTRESRKVKEKEPEPEKEPEKVILHTDWFQPTDKWNMQRFVEDNKEIARYCHKDECWFIWNGKYWKPDESEQIIKLGVETVNKMHQIAPLIRDQKEINALSEHIVKSNNKPKINSMIDFSRPYLTISKDELDWNPYMINFNNGMLDLKTFELKPHDINEHMTMCIDAEYYEDAQCPKWLEQLDLVFNKDEKMIESFQIALGHSLTGIASQYFIICYGGGRNGKDSLLGTVQSILGEYAGVVPPETLQAIKNESAKSASEDVASMDGKRLIVTSEPNRQVTLKMELIKRLTGGNKISSRRNYGHQYTFTPKMAMFLMTNHRPKIDETTDAVRARLRMYPFNVNIPEKFAIEGKQTRPTKEIIDDFVKEEKNGILAWLVEGLKKYNALGDIPFPEKVSEATEHLMTMNNPLARCIKEIAVVREGVEVSKAEWFIAVTNWQVENDEEICKTKPELKVLMEELGYIGHKKKDGHYWKGLKIRTEKDGKDQNLPINN